MGYSCSALVDEVICRIMKKCSPTSNEWTYKGRLYFFEISRKEHIDGSITGSIYEIIQKYGIQFAMKRSGSFRIDGITGSARGEYGFSKLAEV